MHCEFFTPQSFDQLLHTKKNYEDQNKLFNPSRNPMNPWISEEFTDSLDSKEFMDSMDIDTNHGYAWILLIAMESFDIRVPMESMKFMESMASVESMDFH